jgi:hypothetical protein
MHITRGQPMEAASDMANNISKTRRHTVNLDQMGHAPAETLPFGSGELCRHHVVADVIWRCDIHPLWVDRDHHRLRSVNG